MKAHCPVIDGLSRRSPCCRCWSTPWMNPTFIHCAEGVAQPRSANMQRAVRRNRCGGWSWAASCQSDNTASFRTLSTSPRAGRRKLKRTPTQRRCGWLRRESGQRQAARLRETPAHPVRWDGKGTRRGDGQRMHRFADQYFPKHGSNSCLAIAATCERCAAGPLNAMSCRCPRRSITSPRSSARP